MEFADVILSFLTLTVLEIILGIDNLVFLAIITQRLPKSQQSYARKLGLTLAWVSRLILLASALWLTKLTTPVLTIVGNEISWRDIFLIVGGLFLLVKATQEIHGEMEPADAEGVSLQAASFQWVLLQIMVLDIIFSLDSVLTAIGLTDQFMVMAAAISIAILTMIFASEPLSHFVEKHPTVKMLALSFLILIGMVLIADGFDHHIPRGYIYFAMGFSLFVEMMNLVVRKRRGRA